MIVSAFGHGHAIEYVAGLQVGQGARLSSEGLATTAEAMVGVIFDKPVTPQGLVGATNALQRKFDQTINFNLEAARVGRAISSGVSPVLYSKVFEGGAAVMEAASQDDAVSKHEGLACQIVGEGALSTSEAFMLYGGRKWRVKRCEREIRPSR